MRRQSHGMAEPKTMRLNCIYVHCHDDAPNPQLLGRLVGKLAATAIAAPRACCNVKSIFFFSSPCLAFSLHFNMCRECDRVVPGRSTRRSRNVHNCALHVLCSLCHCAGCRCRTFIHSFRCTQRAHSIHFGASNTICQRLCNCLLVFQAFQYAFIMIAS